MFCDACIFEIFVGVPDFVVFRSVTGLFLSNENTRGPAVDLLVLVVRAASRDRS